MDRGSIKFAVTVAYNFICFTRYGLSYIHKIDTFSK